MLIFHSVLIALTGAVVLLLIFNTYLFFRGHNRIYLVLGLICLGGAIYIPCNLMLYDVTTLVRYLNILRVQMYGTAFYHIGLTWFYLRYLNIRQRWPLAAVSFVFGIFLVARTINPMLNYASFSGMTEYLTIWGEQLQLPVTTLSNWGSLYVLWVYSIYFMLTTLSILQLRHERVRATQSLVSILLLTGMATNDVLVLLFNLRWLFLAEMGFTLLIVIMEMAAANEILRVNQLSQQVRENEEKFRILFETSRDFLYITSMDGRIIEVNMAASTMSGYSLKELKNLNIQELYYDASEREALVAQIVTQGYVQNYAMRGRRKDGTVVDTLVNSTAIRDEAGNVVGFQGGIKDISELKRANDALLDSEARFRVIFEHANDAIHIDSAADEILAVNSRMCEMMGYSREELLKMHVADLQAPEVRRTGNIVRHELTEHGSTIFEGVNLNHDGRRIPVEISVGRIETPSDELYVSIVRDITERKQADEKLRLSEERLQLATRAASIGVWDWDVTRNELVWDASMYRLYGIRQEDFEGAYQAWLKCVHPDDAKMTDNEIQAALRGEKEYAAEFRIVWPDGTVHHIQAASQTFRDNTGKPLRMIGTNIDVTERKQAEERIRQQVERLRALHTIEQVVTGSMELNTVLELLVREVLEQLHIDAVSVLLLDEETQKLNFAAQGGFCTEALRYTSLEVGSGLAGLAARDKAVVHIANLTGMENNPVLAKSIREEDFVAYFGVPLVAKGRLQGVMEIFQRSALAPDPDWLEFLETLAGQAAISIDNTRLLETTQQSLKDTDALYRINQDLVALTGAEQLFHKVVDLLQESFGYAYVQVFTADPQSGDFLLRAGSGSVGKKLLRLGHRMAAGEGIVGYSAETHHSFFTNDVDNVVFYKQNPVLKGVKSELTVPIRVGEQLLGMLDVQQTPPGRLSQHDIQLVGAVAGQLAVALQKAHLYADLQEALQKEQAARDRLIQGERLAIAGRLLASVSHELNNPLQAIQNALFLLKDEEGISTQGKQDMKIVISEAERMSAMLERLRVTYQPLRAEDFQPVQINDLVENVFAITSTHLRHRRISFEFHSDPALPAISGLADQLRQVLLNLFINAAEAMNNGGRLIVNTASLPEAGEVMITIRDTGPGIAPSILPQIFEAFITNKQTGTGLGLSISHEIILKHGGRIQAANDPGGGALFSLWLPVRHNQQGDIQ